MSDARPNDHARPALSHDLPAHVGNTDQFPPLPEWELELLKDPAVRVIPSPEEVDRILDRIFGPAR